MFFLQDLKQQQAIKELFEERANEGDDEAAETIAGNVPAVDALAALPKATPKAKAKSKAEPKKSARSKELLQRMEELKWSTKSD